MIRRVLLLMLLAFGIIAMAAPLKNVEVRLTQPDGTVINCFASGDEFYNYLHDANGFTIVKGDNGYYVYATKDSEGNVIPSAYVVNSVDPASVGLQPYVKISEKEYYARRHQREVENRMAKPSTKGSESKRFSNGRELNHGLYNNLVVFIRFSEDTYHTTPFSTVKAMFNDDDYNANSLHNYYHHTSYNQLDLWSHFYPQPDGETILSYEDIYPKEYYMPFDPVTNPLGYQDGETAEREFSMLERAIAYVEDMVPDSIDFDYNDDGLVDNVVFVIKGSPGEWASLLWPHRWCIYDRYVPLHDLQVYDFNLQLEQGGYFNVSTLCHEMFHSLGAPDLYHYGDGFDPVGSWDLMCGTTEPPQQTSTYMKYKYGNWVKDIPIINPEDPESFGTYELEPVSWEGGVRNGYLIPIDDDELFFVEYRDKSNIFENKIPGSGLLIYRIDTRFNGNASWDGYEYFDEVYLFRPGGTFYNSGDLDIAFFNETVGRTAFNSNTNPKPFLNQQPVFDWEYQITGIKKADGRMSFDFRPYEGEESTSGPEHLIAHVNSIEQQVELSWNANPNADYYKVYRDGVEVSSITDTTFISPYTQDDNGYHIYSVVSVTGGTMAVTSAPSESWILLGNYETIELEIQCDAPYGTKGGELQVSFNNGIRDQYLTVYTGTSNAKELLIPANTEMEFTWISGFDPDSQGIRVRATHQNEQGQGTIFDISDPTSGVLAQYVVADEGLGITYPQNLRATVEEDVEENKIHLCWTVPTENRHFNAFRDGIKRFPDIYGYELTDTNFNRSGTYNYLVETVSGEMSAINPEDVAWASLMNYYCEPPQQLTGTHQPNHNELSWQEPQFIGHGMLAYDNDRYLEQTGGEQQQWGIVFYPEQLAYFEGLPLTHLEMFDVAEGLYTYKIFNGERANSASLIHTQQQEMTGSYQWSRFALEQEVVYDANLPLWIAVSSTGAEQPIPCCSYINEPNSCQIINGTQWKPITFYGINYSWLLRAYTRPMEITRNFTYNVYVGPEEAEDYQMDVAFQNLTATTLTHNSNENLRYNVTALWNGKETGFSNSIFLGPSVDVEEETVAETDCFAYISNGQIIITGVETFHETSLQIIDMTGRIIRVCRDARHCVSTEGMPPGVYVLRLIDGNNVRIQKIVKHL